jgi:hypothetical protein
MICLIAKVLLRRISAVQETSFESKINYIGTTLKVKFVHGPLSIRVYSLWAESELVPNIPACKASCCKP